MMDVLEVLSNEIDKKVQQLKDWLGSGQSQDYPDYQKICGEIKGLLVAKQHILDLKQNLENSNDE